jgi:ferredoxin
MCEFCIKHGEGRKWYLEAKNYSEDLLSDLARRKMMTQFFSRPELIEQSVKQLERLDRAPSFVRRVLRWRVSNTMKRFHFGQVVPIEEVEQILAFTTSVVRLPCICRRTTVGAEHRFCYGVSMGQQGGQLMELVRQIDPAYLLGPNAAGLEVVSREEALEAMRRHEREGLCHTVWTFMSPFIGGICNCDRSDCLAMRATVTHSVPVMFRAEYVAGVNGGACDGCRSCMRHCQFGAMGFSAAQSKIFIDPRRCYGCGVCRAACKKDVISLRPRSQEPAASKLWQ